MDELISKQAAIEAINLWLYCDKDERMPADVIKALPTVYVPDTNVGDMISRKVAMEMLMAKNVIMDGSEYHNGFNAGVNRAQEVIRNLPPVQSKRGKWIPEYKNPCYNGYYKIPSYCSCCKDYYTQSPEEMNFCPHCGADMRGNEDGTD